MTVATSSIPAALAYLYTAAVAAFPAALVLYGPPRVSDQQSMQDVVSIGWDGDEQMSSPAVEGDQEFATISRALTRNEDYRIVCSVMHWDGTDNAQAATNAAFALLATFEKLLRGYPPNGTGDTTLGGAVLWSHVAGGVAADLITDANGAACRVIFHVTCRARLTGF